MNNIISSYQKKEENNNKENSLKEDDDFKIFVETMAELIKDYSSKKR